MSGDLVPPAWQEELSLSPPEPRRGHPALRWTLFLILAWFVGGVLGLIVGIAIRLFLLFRSNRLRELFIVAIALLGLVPIVVLFRGLPGPSTVGFDFVLLDMPAHYLAEAGLLVLVVAMLRSVLAQPAPPQTLPADEELAELLGEPQLGAGATQEKRRIAVSSFAMVMVGLAIASFVLRLAVSGAAAPNPLTGNIAANLLGGAGYTRTGLFGRHFATALRVPLVPTLLALTGTAAKSVEVARFVWAAMGAATVLAVGVAARRVFGVVEGLLAAAFVALLPNFWLQSVRLASGPVAALEVSLLLLVIASPRGMRLSLARAFSGGALVGALALTRPEGLLVGALMVGGWLTGRRVTNDSPQRLASVWVAAGLGAVLLLGPWMLRNHSQFHTYLPTTEYGTLAAGANAPSTYQGRFVGSFDPLAVDRATREVTTGLISEAGLQEKLLTHGERFASGDPGRLAYVLPIRVLRTFEIWSPLNEQAAHRARGVAVKGWLVQWAGFVGLLALAGLGYWRWWPRRIALAPLFLAPVAVAAVALVSYGEPLMRASIDPVLAIAAGTGLVGIGKAASDRSRHQSDPSERERMGRRSSRVAHRLWRALPWPRRKSPT